MGMDELPVVVDFAREIGIVLAGSLEDHLSLVSTLRSLEPKFSWGCDAHLCAICQIMPGKVDLAEGAFANEFA